MQMWRRAGQTVPQVWFGNAIKIRCVCKACNNGWMSVLEECAKPILSPLIQDLSYPLQWNDQLLLTLWTIKTAMVFEAAKADSPSFFTPEERAALLETFEPPPHTFVWIGRYAHYVGGYGEARHLRDATTRNPNVQSPLRDGYANTFAFGHFIVQCLSARMRPDSGQVKTTLDIRRGPWARTLTQIWPIKNQSVTWPPTDSISDHGTTLDDLAHRFVI
jgi:hypothetical protein